MVKVKKKNLDTILKIIAEEASKKSKRTLLENDDPAIKNLESELRNFNKKKNENELVQEEEEEGEVEEAPPENTENEEQPAEKAKPETDPAEFGSSFDKVVKDINTLRAGRSTKDSEIKNELMGYYDRLSEDERVVLHVFLKQLSSILSGALSGDEAQDPSDEPFNANIELGKEKEAEPEEKSEKPEEEKEQIPKKQIAKSKPKAGEEDTSPPIKVNEQQDLNEIRERVKLLMKRY